MAAFEAQEQIEMAVGIIYVARLRVSFWRVTGKLRLEGCRGTTT